MLRTRSSAPRALFALIILMALSSCIHTIRVESANQNSRVSILVIHYTSGDFLDSLNALTLASDRPVSSHYLIPEPLDKSYGRSNIKIHKLVKESSRAWHAGDSQWKDRTNINDMSIGIELVNRAACTESSLPLPWPEQAMAEQTLSQDNGSDEVKPPEFCFYPDYSEQQVALLIKLARGILERHPDIHPTSVIGHSDIAPDRKIDPGPRFPWQRLYKAGIGAWFDNDIAVSYWQKFQIEPPSLMAIQRALNIYGYKLNITGELDQQSRDVLRAFQMHFNPASVTQRPDIKTVSILFALIDKYYPDSLAKICAVEQGEAQCPELIDPAVVPIQTLAL